MYKKISGCWCLACAREIRMYIGLQEYTRNAEIRSCRRAARGEVEKKTSHISCIYIYTLRACVYVYAGCKVLRSSSRIFAVSLPVARKERANELGREKEKKGQFSPRVIPARTSSTCPSLFWFLFCLFFFISDTWVYYSNTLLGHTTILLLLPLLVCHTLASISVVGKISIRPKRREYG